MPRKSQNIPPNENASQRFVRLANHRVNVILTGLKTLGQLGGSQYESKPEQRKKIEDVLTTAVKKSVENMSKGETTQEFKL